MTRILLLAVALIAATAHITLAQRQVPRTTAEVTLSFAPVVEIAAPAVVNIYATRVVAQRLSPFADDPFFSQFFGGPDRTVPRVQNSLGSGVIVRPDGIVVSNHHVVGEATSIRVVLPDRREYDGEIILSDAGADLAIIRLRDAQGLPALDLADSDSAAVGDLVLAIGNPFGVGQTVTSGIVSGLARSGGTDGRGAGHFIQTDAPINPGNSGGALVDMAGRLLGINTSILTRSGGSNGIGFAIPANLVRQYVAQAASGATGFRRPWSGIAVQTIDAQLAEALGQTLPQGVLIAEIHPQSPFSDAGLRPGDVIVALDGAPVNSNAELDYRLAVLGPGAETAVTWLRDGDRRTATVTLAPVPTDDAAPLRIGAGSAFEGLVVAAITPGLIERFDLPLSATGVVILDVPPHALRSGLRPGDIVRAVNGRAPRDGEDLARALGGTGRFWDLELERGGRPVRLRLRG